MAAKGHLASNTSKAALDAAASFAALYLFIDVPQVGDRLAEYQIVAAQLIRARCGCFLEASRRRTVRSPVCCRRIF